MGRFTLRDEGKTIALGKVLKYKPVKVNAFQLATQAAAQQTTQQSTEEAKSTDAVTTVTTKTEEKTRTDLVYDLDSGEMVTQDEYNRRQKERELEDIGEEDEDEDGEEDED